MKQEKKRIYFQSEKSEEENQNEEQQDRVVSDKKKWILQKKDIQIVNLSVLFTLSSGYSQKNEKPLAMSYFGYQIGRKLIDQELNQYQEEKQKRLEKKQKKKLKKLDQSIASDLNRSQIRKK